MKKAVFFAFVLTATSALFAAKKGSCESEAVGMSLNRTYNLQLTAEYDSDFREYDDSGMGVYYLAITLKRGAAYTLTYGGASAGNALLTLCHKRICRK